MENDAIKKYKNTQWQQIACNLYANEALPNILIRMHCEFRLD
jgi:hypothetical protein